MERNISNDNGGYSLSEETLAMTRWLFVAEEALGMTVGVRSLWEEALGRTGACFYIIKNSWHLSAKSLFLA